MTKLIHVIFSFQFILFVSLLKYISRVSAEPNNTKWAQTTTHNMYEQKTTLQFYFHDNVTGDYLTTAKIGQPEDSGPGVTGFGKLFMVDDPLTMGPKLDSKLVGRAQGMWGRASKEDPGLLMSLSYNFLEGIYNGSSFSLLGRNSVLESGREMPVVGGTGVFRMGRGYALAQNYHISNYNSIVGYNVTIFH